MYAFQAYMKISMQMGSLNNVCLNFTKTSWHDAA